MLRESTTGGLDRKVLPGQASSSVIASGFWPNCSEPSARAVLRSATDGVHERMHRHAGFAQLAAGTIERATYRRLFARSYGFYTMAESLIGRSNDWVCHLADDLADLGLADQEIPRLPQCPPPTIGEGDAERVGATYVLLGASLGGKVMARAVADNASASEPLPTRFLAGDGNAAWKDFVTQLDLLLPDRCARDAAARAAVTMFAAFENWMNGWTARDE